MGIEIEKITVRIAQLCWHQEGQNCLGLQDKARRYLFENVQHSGRLNKSEAFNARED